MIGYIVWAVWCLGVGLAVSASSQDRSWGDRLLTGAALWCLLWSGGLLLWSIPGWIAGPL